VTIYICGELTVEENLTPKERSNLGFPFAGDVVSEEGQEKRPMKSDNSNHTLADRSGAAYGDNASNNTAITCGVEGDVVGGNKYVYEAPTPHGSVLDI
jgi:hypothetical protein